MPAHPVEILRSLLARLARRQPAAVRAHRCALVAFLAVAVGVPALLAGWTANAQDGAAPAARRASLLPLVQPLWSELSPGQQAVLQPFSKHWNTLPLEEKRAWVRVANRFAHMKPAEQQKAQERIREWASLTPAQRRTARMNYRLAKKLTKEQRAAQWERYQSLTQEQRAVLRSSGITSNTAARHAGSRSGLGKEAAQPMSRFAPRQTLQPTSTRTRD